MNFWDNIINTAIIGTEKKSITEQDVTDALQPAFKQIQSNAAIDKGEKFLHVASLAFNYRQSGTVVLNKEITINPAPAEEKKYCNQQSLQVLTDILSEENIPLLNLWLNHCQQNEQILTPAFVPVLLAKGVQHKKMQSLISYCCGRRGVWLAGYNNAWDFGNTESPESVWQTGTPDQRKTVLAETRKTDPATALERLKQTWPQEDAATRLGFLEILGATISDNDISFLESLTADKSKKVKEEAMLLLKSTPGSPIVQQYIKAFQQSVSLQTEKKLLGLSSKKSLQFHLSVTDENIYKTGIDKLSNNKELTDDEFILYQLTGFVPPSFWEDHLHASKEQVIQYLQNHDTGKKLIPAFVNAIVRFKAGDWALAFMQHSAVFYIDIIPLLPVAEQDAYSQKFLAQFPESIIQYAGEFDKEWSAGLTKEIFKYTAKNNYYYNRSFYSNIIHLVPVQALAELEKATPAEEYYREQWKNMSDYITKLVHLKQETIKYFIK